MAARPRRLDEPELGDVAADRRLRHREAAIDQPVGQLVLAADRLARDDLADRPLPVALRARAPTGDAVGAAACVAADAPIAADDRASGRPDRGSTGRDPGPEGRVAEGTLEGASADESAMIASDPSQASAASAARIFGTMPPAMTPLSISVSASPAVRVSSRRPSASRTPSTSVIRTSCRAPRPAAIPAAASSALTLQTMPVLVAGQRRHDRHLATDEDRVEQVAAQADDVGDEAHPRRRAR